MEQAEDRDIFSEKETRILHRIRVIERRITFYTRLTWILVTGGFLISIPGLYFFFNGKITINELGDYWAGSIASVWALAGVVFIFVAFLGQKQQLYFQQLELMYNREEMVSTRAEIEGQRALLDMQGEEIKVHRFENTFFNLLSMLANTALSLRLRFSDTMELKGNDVIRHKSNQLQRLVLGKMDKESITSEIGKVEHQVLTEISQYYTLFFSVIEYTDSTSLKDKEQYYQLLSSRTSIDELIFLFYLVHAGQHFAGKKEICRKLGVFGLVKPTDLLTPGHLAILG